MTRPLLCLALLLLAGCYDAAPWCSEANPCNTVAPRDTTTPDSARDDTTEAR